MSTWEIAILMCIRDIGNEAMLQQTYRTIRKGKKRIDFDLDDLDI
jgi:hypothetical protein